MTKPGSSWDGDDVEAELIVKAMCDLLEVEPLDTNLYRGGVTDEPWPRVFGGQVVAQAMQAATHSVADDRSIHSLHAYFLRPGDPKRPIIYRVEPDRDGRSFSTRRVIALQDGVAILNLAASFHTDEAGLTHSVGMPQVTPPEDLVSVWSQRCDDIERLPTHYRALARRRRAIEFRRVEPLPSEPDPQRTSQHFWFRSLAPLPDHSRLHRAVLAYASDTFLVEATLSPHGIAVPESAVDGASLDHAIWFHAPARADAWLLYAQDSPWSGAGRGLALGRIYTRHGRLVMSIAQEGLIRPRPRA